MSLLAGLFGGSKAQATPSFAPAHDKFSIPILDNLTCAIDSTLSSAASTVGSCAKSSFAALPGMGEAIAMCTTAFACTSVGGNAPASQGFSLGSGMDHVSAEKNTADLSYLAAPFAGQQRAASAMMLG